MRLCPFGELEALALIEGMFRRGLLMTVIDSATDPEPVPVGVAAPMRSRAEEHVAASRGQSSAAGGAGDRRTRDIEPGPGGR